MTSENLWAALCARIMDRTQPLMFLFMCLKRRPIVYILCRTITINIKSKVVFELGLEGWEENSLLFCVRLSAETIATKSERFIKEKNLQLSSAFSKLREGLLALINFLDLEAFTVWNLIQSSLFLKHMRKPCHDGSFLPWLEETSCLCLGFFLLVSWKLAWVCKFVYIASDNIRGMNHNASCFAEFCMHIYNHVIMCYIIIG